MKNTAGLFVVGTDTNVGKTYVVAQLARLLREEGVSVGIYKPACSGARRDPSGQALWDDVEAHFDAMEGEFPRERICPQCFLEPVAPPVAARCEGRAVDDDLLVAGAEWWMGRVDVLLVEGAGGLLSPLSASSTVADVADQLGFPLLLIAHWRLGTLNQTLLTLEVAEGRGLTTSGVILNAVHPGVPGLAERTNAEELRSRTAVPILGVLPYEGSVRLLEQPHLFRIVWKEIARTSGRFPPRQNH